jgi:chemotaxis response regulator CheB
VAGLSILVVSPSIVERSRLIRALGECRPDWQVTQASDLPDALGKLDMHHPDIVLLSHRLQEPAATTGAIARIAASGRQAIALHGTQAGRRREDIPDEDWDATAPATAVQCLEALLDRIATLGRGRVPRRAQRTHQAPTARHPSTATAARRQPAAARTADRPPLPAPAEPEPTARGGTALTGSAPRADGPAGRVVLIGASTGGIDALLTVLAHFPADCPPTAIVQHTGRGFSLSMVRVLSRKCAARIVVAEELLVLEPGMICVAGGLDGHLQLKQLPDRRLRCSIQGGPQVSGQRPSIDVLFRSATPLAERAIGVLLTGMGADGAAGLLALRQAGATTIGQDEATSVVYGMPRVAYEMGAVCHQLPLRLIGPAIRQLVQTADPDGPRESRFHD